MDYSQYKGKPFQVISKLQVRYTGIFQDIDQETQTLCLSEVYNHGTEDRPSQRVLPGSPNSLGWVRFHTNSIESLALIENYVPPPTDEPIDPILASVSKSGPSQAARPATSQHRQGGSALPSKPTASAASANTAMDRVQKSLSELSVDGSRRRRQPQAQPPAVPNAEFDFSKGTERFQKEREAHKAQEETKDDDDSSDEELGAPEHQPHPSAFASAPEPDTHSAKPAVKKPVYNKASFFDNISSESSRVSRAEERHRNLDTFGEAGGSDALGGQRGGFGGRGMGGRGRGRGRRGDYGQARQYGADQ